MATFALITEGITDQAVIETLIAEYCSASFGDDIDINFLQPIRDATDEARAGEFAGWEKVLEYCSLSDKIRDALALNDYVVIQIDTDCADHLNFDVQKVRDGHAKSIADLIEDVKKRLIDKITSDIYERHKQQFVFAIAVHSVECWLLPLHAKKAEKKSHIMDCEARLRKELAREKSRYKKDYKTYRELAHKFNKMKNITDATNHSESLKAFVDSLP